MPLITARRTRWQVSSPFVRRPIQHGEMLRDYAAALHPMTSGRARCFLDRSYGVQSLDRAPFVAELEANLTNLEAAG